MKEEKCCCGLFTITVIVQVFLLLEIFYSVAAAIFPSIPLPEAIKDLQNKYDLHWHTVEDKATNIFQSIAFAMLIINIILYAISLRVLIILIKCFFSIKSKRYQPVPSIYRMPPRPTLPLVVKKNEDNKQPSSPTPETAIEMSEVEQK